jgi:hypothetical protein
MESREGTPGCAGQALPGPFGPRELFREFILPPFNPGAGVCGPLTLIDLVKVLLTLAAGSAGYWAFDGYGVLWGIIGAAGHCSLDDPLMKVFAGEWVKEVLQRLGMDESAPVESGMVARRVRGAQGKFAARAERGCDAASAEEWLQSNGFGEPP